MTILVQFVYQLGLGLALGMALTSSREVDCGYFRAHSWVLLGLAVLAAAVTATTEGLGTVWLPVLTAVMCYAAAALWLYGKSLGGRAALVVVVLLNFAGAWQVYAPTATDRAIAAVAILADVATAGALVGTTVAAMLLGHWYLSHPGMQLAPLRRFVVIITVAVVARALVSGVGLALLMTEGEPFTAIDWAFLGLRWLAGLGGTAGAAVLVWYTLMVPNTQSATGILYVAVITTFLGELSGQLLSATRGYAL